MASLAAVLHASDGRFDARQITALGGGNEIVHRDQIVVLGLLEFSGFFPDIGLGVGG